MELDESRTAALRELVKRYLVCWDVCPQLPVVDKRQRQVGFELELCGSHVPKASTRTRLLGMQQVFQALYAIVEYILPAEGRASMYEIGSVRAAMASCRAKA